MWLSNKYGLLTVAVIVAISGCSTIETNVDTVQPVSVSIDLSKTHQTIHSFGASDAWSINPLVNHWLQEGDNSQVEKLANLLFSADQGIGLSAWRFNVGAGSAEQGNASEISDDFRRAELLMPEPGGKIDGTKQRGQIRMLQEARERGVDNFVAFINSPPVWATKNGLAYPATFTEMGDVGSSNLKPESMQDFVNFQVSVLRYLQEDAGVPVNYISPVNEPTWDWEGGTAQEANRYNNDDLKTLYRTLYTALQSAGLSTPVTIDGTEAVEFTAALSDDYKTRFDGSVYHGGMNSRDNGSYKNYIDQFLGDGEMRTILGNKISMHGYWSEAWTDRLTDLRVLTKENIRNASPDAEVWMSEVCILGNAGDIRQFNGHGFNVNDMDYAIHIARMINQDMTLLDTSAWHWWLAVTPYNYKDGLLKISPTLNADTLQTSKVFWALGNFSRFIRPGYQRVETSWNNNLQGLMTSAYLSDDQSKLVTVLVNASDSESFVINLDVSNTPDARSIRLSNGYVTDAGQNLKDIGTLARIINIGPESIMTIVSDLK